MGYKFYAYGAREVYNVPDDYSGGFLPSDLKIDPTSNAETLIVTLSNGQTTLRGVSDGSFTYNAVKATFADVTKSFINNFTLYQNGVMAQKETFDPSVDGYNLLFGTYQQKLALYKGDDEFVGSSTSEQSDKVRGSTGNDRFTGYGNGLNTDSFNGESGFDVAFLRGKLSEYTITSTMILDILKNDGSRVSGFQVRDKVTGRDGIDEYTNVERLYFVDKVLALDTNGNAGQAYRLYQAALDRTPDERGLAGWIKFMDEGGALVTMAQQFIESQEFRTKYGALDNRNFVNQLYLNVLDRNGETSGINGWVNGLENGLTRSDVLKGFSESTENQANVLGQIRNGISYSEWWLV